MKQTAVQWLVDEYFGGIENCTPDFRYHINKALEMEKEQIEYAHVMGGDGEKQAEEYYKEKYEAQND